MTTPHESLVQHQFGSSAEDYVTSTAHADGADLQRIAAIAAASAPAHALDLGCGGGHVSYAISPHALRVTACDLSAEMLAAVEEEAQERRIDNIETKLAAAESLPFSDVSFDFLACRFSVHHWQDVTTGLSEARRVLRPGATAMFADVIAPAMAAADTHLQAIELLRDSSHGRDYTLYEWQNMLANAGFTVNAVTKARLRMEFSSWTARMRTPSDLAQAVRRLQGVTSSEVSNHFAIEGDGSFTLDTVLIEVS